MGLEDAGDNWRDPDTGALISKRFGPSAIRDYLAAKGAGNIQGDKSAPVKLEDAASPGGSDSSTAAGQLAKLIKGAAMRKVPHLYSVGLPAQLDTPVVTGPLPIPSPPDEASPVAASPAPDAPPQQGDAELASAQGADTRSKALSHLGGLFAHYADVTRGVDTSATDKLYEKAEDNAGKRAQNLVDQREAIRKANADQLQKDLSDPSSTLSKRRQMLAMASGLFKPGEVSGMSWNDLEAVRPYMEKGASLEQAKTALEGENKRAADQRATQLQIERERMAAERAMKLEDINAKAQEAKQGKPVPEQEASKVVTMAQSLPAIDQLEQQFYKAGLGAPNENTRYELMKNALAPIIAAGASPAARENAQLMEEFKKGMPSVSGWNPLGNTRDANGKQYFQALREAVRGNQQAQTQLLGAGPYDKGQVAELQRQAEVASGPAKDAGHHDGKSVTGYRYNKDRSKRIPVYSDGSQGAPEAV